MFRSVDEKSVRKLDLLVNQLRNRDASRGLLVAESQLNPELAKEVPTFLTKFLCG